MLSKLLKEGFTREEESDIEDIIDSKFDDFEDRVLELAEEHLDSNDAEDRIKDVTVDSFENLFKTLWQRRGTWRGGI